MEDEIEEKQERSFFEQAARSSWILPLVAMGVMAVFSSPVKSTLSHVSVLILGGVLLLLLLAGVISGIVGCCGVKRHGARTTVVPGAIGAVFSAAILGLLVAIAVPSFFKAREASLQKRSVALQQLAEQTNKQLPVMVDSETRVDRMTVLAPDLVEYSYTFVNSPKDELEPEAFAAEVRPKLLERYRTSDNMKAFRENRIAISFSYHSKDGQLITNIVVSAKDVSKR
jgi:hypothetical protein